MKKEMLLAACDLIPITQKEGQYVTPVMPCGVLPCFLDPHSLIHWGCVESNRVGVIALTPPTGTQDIVVQRDNKEITLEFAKPLPHLSFDFLKPFIGLNFSGDNYQAILTAFKNHGYELYFENPISTAFHETAEEHGTDIGNGHHPHNHLVDALLDFEPQPVRAKRGFTNQKILVALLHGHEEIQLKYTDKIEQKIAANRGRAFYERGVWGTLKAFNQSFAQEKTALALKKSTLEGSALELMEAELAAFESRLTLMAKIEQSMVTYLSTQHIPVTSSSTEKSLPYTLVFNPEKELHVPESTYAKDRFFLSPDDQLVTRIASTYSASMS